MSNLNKLIFDLEKKAPLDAKWFWVSKQVRQKTGVTLSPNAVRKRYGRYAKRAYESFYREGEPSTSTFTEPEYKENVSFSAKNVLVISDTHIPFELPGALDWLKRLRDRYKCDKVIHIGDVLDGHAISRWVSDPDGYSSGQELEESRRKVKAWYNAFPDMHICIGNHDDRPMRAIYNAGLSSRFLKHFNDILDTPNWVWNWSYTQNGEIFYTHGTEKGGKYAAVNLARDLGVSVVMGHTHTVPGVNWLTNRFKSWFALNVGCLIDSDRYAFAYGARHTLKVTLGAGLVLDNGLDPRFVKFHVGI